MRKEDGGSKIEDGDNADRLLARRARDDAEGFFDRGGIVNLSALITVATLRMSTGGDEALIFRDVHDLGRRESREAEDFRGWGCRRRGRFSTSADGKASRKAGAKA